MVGYVEPNNTLSSIGSVFVIIGSYEGDGDDEISYLRRRLKWEARHFQ